MYDSLGLACGGNRKVTLNFPGFGVDLGVGYSLMSLFLSTTELGLNVKVYLC